MQLLTHTKTTGVKRTGEGEKADAGVELTPVVDRSAADEGFGYEASVEEGAGPNDLPPGWVVAASPEGQTYYCNRETGESSWTVPSSKRPPPPPRRD